MIGIIKCSQHVHGGLHACIQCHSTAQCTCNEAICYGVEPSECINTNRNLDYITTQAITSSLLGHTCTLTCMDAEIQSIGPYKCHHWPHIHHHDIPIVQIIVSLKFLVKIQEYSPALMWLLCHVLHTITFSRFPRESIHAQQQHVYTYLHCHRLLTILASIIVIAHCVFMCQDRHPTSPLYTDIMQGSTSDMQWEWRSLPLDNSPPLVPPKKTASRSSDINNSYPSSIIPPPPEFGGQLQDISREEIRDVNFICVSGCRML